MGDAFTDKGNERSGEPVGRPKGLRIGSKVTVMGEGREVFKVAHWDNNGALLISYDGKRSHGWESYRKITLYKGRVIKKTQYLTR